MTQALSLIGAGILRVVSSALAYALPAIRNLEADLPDYADWPAAPTALSIDHLRPE